MSGETCAACKGRQPDFTLDGLLAAADFKEKSLLQRAIHDLKYNFVEDLAEPLGQLFIGLLQNFSADEVLLCPVPLHPKRLRWRGFNQAEILAKRAGAGLELPVQNLLVRTTFKKPQMELSREERLKNVVDAFMVEGVEGAGAAHEELLASIRQAPPCVLLVDDVATTLSTLNACAAALKKAGVKKVYGLVLARVY